MKYIENDGHVTREYEVKINTEELEEIIRELSKRCYRFVNKETRVAANNEEEALEKINAMDKSGIKVNRLTNISNEYPRETLSTGLQVFDCEYLLRQNSQLVYILETILSNYRSSLDFKNQNYKFIDLLINFENSLELVPYDNRLNTYKDEILNARDDVVKQKNIKREVEATMQEMEYNSHYNFELLDALYQRAKECFDLILVAETVHYKDLDSNPKIYKLGTKKCL